MRLDSSGSAATSWLGLPELAETVAGERRQAAKLLREIRRADPGQPVRPTAVLRRKRFDQAALLEPGESRVERSRSEWPTGRLLDVGHDRVAVLRTVGQTDEDEQRRFGEPSEFGDRWLHLGSSSYDCRYIDTR